MPDTPLTLDALLARGYFPRELPPPFSSDSFGAYAKSLGPGASLPFNTIANGLKTSKPEIFNLARAGSFRRELSILNPVHFSVLAEYVVKNQDTLWVESSSNLSLTSPTVKSHDRAIARANDLSVLPTMRAEVRSSGRFLLKADISRFYPSIYTHSIPWAIHGKDFAKTHRDPSHIGNRLDQLISKCQDGQTNGIPIGPDTSLLISEIILAKIDRVLRRKRVKGFRYMDDFEIVCEDERRALEIRSILQEELLKFELHLGESKTSIQPLPVSLEESWVVNLNRLPLDGSFPSFHKQVIRFFDKAFELAKTHPQDGVLKYAAGRISKIRISPSHIELTENLLMQCAQVEAGALSFVLACMLRNETTTAPRKKRRHAMLLDLINTHASQRHSSEVAWALWACIVMRLPISAKAVRAVLGMEDSICALLILHARRLKLLAAPSSASPLRDTLDAKALYGSRWLLAYEANVKGWFQFRGNKDYVSLDPNFKILKQAKVSFYDETRTVVSKPKTQARWEDDGDEIDDYLSRISGDYGDKDEDYYDDDDEDDSSEEPDNKENGAQGLLGIQ